MNPLDLFGRHRNLAFTSTAVPQIIEGIHSLEVVKVEGYETLDMDSDSIFEYKILLKTPAELSVIPAEVLLQSFDLANFTGKTATLHIALDDVRVAGMGNVRQITGVIATAQFKRVAERALHFEIVLKDWLWLGTKNKDYLIHQNQTVVQTLQDTLNDNKTFPYMFDVRLNNHYPIRDICVRMAEDSTSFVKRLCQEYGINLHYECFNETARLVLSDDNNAFKPYPSPAYHSIRYHGDPDFIDEEHWHTFSPSRSLTTATVTYRDHSYVAPDATNEASHSDPARTRDNTQVNHANAEQYHYHTNAFTNTVQPRAGAEEANDPFAEGQVFTMAHLQSLKQHDDRATAAGNVRAAVVGCSFKLINHPMAQANIDYVVVSARLLIEEVASETQRMNDAQQWAVDTTVTLQPATIPLRPKRTLEKPRIHGVEIGRVVGYKGDSSVWTDDLGRIRIAMPWHRNDPMDETSTCWVRVSSNAAGNQQGSIHLPRIGDECLISYIGGDPDLPVCTGIVYNSTHMPPWTLPKNQALSGYRSRELKPGNQADGLSNHLVLDDSVDSIQTQLVSEFAQSSLSLGRIRGISGNEGLGAQRGSGFALESKDWGVMRSAKGMYVTTYARDNVSNPIKSMGETIAQLTRSVQQHKNTTDSAIEHKAYDQSIDNATQAALKQQLDGIKGGGKGEDEQFPELSEAHILVSSPVGVEIITEQSTHIASGHNTAMTTGGELSFSVIKRFFASVGSGIRLFAQSKGIWLTSAKDPIRLEAQSDNIELYAEQNIDAKGKRKIILSAGEELTVVCKGSYIKIDDSGVEIGSPKQIRFYAPISVSGNKSLAQTFNEMPQSKFDQELHLVGAGNKSIKGVGFEVDRAEQGKVSGKTDGAGSTLKQKAHSLGDYAVRTKGKVK
ncbi:type VI secretion system Vgr family protein [Hydromonas duriensis]|uniref:Type VI secretion system secreted protein VgrG n=1 Tax=Hydromonas duriensis TaxID=1527608 RepID=A0A4V3DJG8_9BURK|nr:type VI secretion system Vgr family protein [Hydromonas duriensis]TDR28941.1 type VI secretion system secreted protein VgrG [Hydromonas duriensis]